MSGNLPILFWCKSARMLAHSLIPRPHTPTGGGGGGGVWPGDEASWHIITFNACVVRRSVQCDASSDYKYYAPKGNRWGTRCTFPG